MNVSIENLTIKVAGRGGEVGKQRMIADVFRRVDLICKELPGNTGHVWTDDIVWAGGLRDGRH